MNAVIEFIAMDGHGPYVWSAYAITLVILWLNVAEPRRYMKSLVQAEARRRRREEINAS
ncbi:MAG: heme exporter protein CcmD [Gammaproteobacteria bacterium HGW-Gammaproteobacteria-11]|nr:MAG: heme exporter protein CcmD [Gammaproteobacteria bacterium HGW-Gammaproteobacteria-11]